MPSDSRPQWREDWTCAACPLDRDLSRDELRRCIGTSADEVVCAALVDPDRPAAVTQCPRHFRMRRDYVARHGVQKLMRIVRWREAQRKDEADRGVKI